MKVFQNVKMTQQSIFTKSWILLILVNDLRKLSKLVPNLKHIGTYIISHMYCNLI